MQSRSIGPTILRASRRGARRRAGAPALGADGAPSRFRRARGRAPAPLSPQAAAFRDALAPELAALPAAERGGDRRLLRGARLCAVLDRAGQRAGGRAGRGARRERGAGAAAGALRRRGPGRAARRGAIRPRRGRARGGGDARLSALRRRPLGGRADPVRGRSRTSPASRRGRRRRRCSRALETAPVAGGAGRASSRRIPDYRRLIAEKARLEALARTGDLGAGGRRRADAAPGRQRPAGRRAARAAGAARLPRADGEAAGAELRRGLDAGGRARSSATTASSTTAWSARDARGGQRAGRDAAGAGGGQPRAAALDERATSGARYLVVNIPDFTRDALSRTASRSGARRSWSARRRSPRRRSSPAW